MQAVAMRAARQLRFPGNSRLFSGTEQSRSKRLATIVAEAAGDYRTTAAQLEQPARGNQALRNVEDRGVSLSPYFTLKDGITEEELKTLCQRLVVLTSAEPGCLYYGFTFCFEEDCKVFHCREAYKDGESAVAHVKHVKQLLDELLQLGNLEKFEVHGPREELDRVKEDFAALNPTYFVLESGFRMSSE